MSTRSIAAAAAAILAILSLAQPALAQKRPIQVALFEPVQIFPVQDTIAGLRLNILYGRNAAMYGLDIGLVNKVDGTVKGLQYGIVGLTRGFRGWQDNVVNIDRERFEGFQSGAVNISESFGGFQYAVVNSAQTMNGLQLAVVNYARRMHGLQVGIVNIIAEGGAFPVFPIVNWSF